jgi:hypothetical protein
MWLDYFAVIRSSRLLFVAADFPSLAVPLARSENSMLLREAIANAAALRASESAMRAHKGAANAKSTAAELGFSIIRVEISGKQIQWWKSCSQTQKVVAATTSDAATQPLARRSGELKLSVASSTPASQSRSRRPLGREGTCQRLPHSFR